MFGLFKKKVSEDPHEPLVIVPIPALVVVLVQKERAKGAPLSREEVEKIRDAAVCMTMRQSHARKWKSSEAIRTLTPNGVGKIGRLAGKPCCTRAAMPNPALERTAGRALRLLSVRSARRSSAAAQRGR